MQNSKNILLICGHPDKDSLTGLMTDYYQASAEDAGHTIFRFDVGRLNFDPILHKGYKEAQPLEPDLINLQEKMKFSDHIVVVYPNWWCSMPALLKGLFDRIWLPGFAYNSDTQTGKTQPLLKGKTARVIIFSGTQSPLKTWWKFGDYTNEIQYAILNFAGIKTEVSAFGPSENADPDQQKKWAKEISDLGRKGL